MKNLQVQNEKEKKRQLDISSYLFFLSFFFPLHNTLRLYAHHHLSLSLCVYVCIYLLPPTSFRCIYYLGEKEARKCFKKKNKDRRKRKRETGGVKYAAGNSWPAGAAATGWKREKIYIYRKERGESQMKATQPTALFYYLLA